ncbi:MAG: hypothetical protein LBL00_03120, partial [Endomicrobium sp.]|nr:hypothetical protein [Endomicrobium sp.]
MNKLISIFTTLCFIISAIGSDIAYAAASGNDGNNVENATSFIPFNLGRVIESKTFADSPYTVINIQDLHCHIEVQKNIEQIMENLQKSYNVSAVFVEGGYGEVDTGIFGRVKDEKLRNNIIEGLFEKGRLTGAEYYYLKNDVKIPFYGLEDETVHKQNLKRLSKALDGNAKYNEKLSEIRSEIDYLKAKYFSRENHKFTDTFENYKYGKMPIERYYALLKKYIEKLSQNDDKYNSLLSFSHDKYPIFSAYCKLLNAGKNINYNKASLEMQGLVNHLKDKLSYNDYSKLSLATAGFSNIEELSLRLPELSQKYGININASGSLGQLINYMAASRKINPVELINEERRISEDIRIAFSATAEETEISFLSDFYIYLEAFLNTKITAGDYEFFEKEYPRFEKIYSKYAFNNTLDSMKEDINFLTQYYRINKDRNAIFVKNIEKRLNKKSGNDIVIVVTGGFHSEGLNKIFTQNRTSYISLMPVITQETKTAEESYNYFLAKGNIFEAQTLALALALQASRAEIAQMMIEIASSSLSSLSYSEQNIAFLIQGISEALGEKIDFSFSADKTVITLADGFTITLQNSGGKIELPAETVEKIEEINKLKFSAAASASAGTAADAASLYNAVFNPRTYQTVKNIMKFAAENNIITGDGLIFDIETDLSLPDVIDGVHKNLIRKMPESIQEAILKAYKRDELLNGEVRIAARIFLAAYSALGYDKAALERFMPQPFSSSEEVSAQATESSDMFSVNTSVDRERMSTSMRMFFSDKRRTKKKYSETGNVIVNLGANQGAFKEIYEELSEVLSDGNAYIIDPKDYHLSISNNKSGTSDKPAPQDEVQRALNAIPNEFFEVLSQAGGKLKGSFDITPNGQIVYRLDTDSEIVQGFFKAIKQHLPEGWSKHDMFHINLARIYPETSQEIINAIAVILDRWNKNNTIAEQNYRGRILYGQFSAMGEAVPEAFNRDYTNEKQASELGANGVESFDISDLNS